MKYTLNIDKLKEDIPEIFFNEWKLEHTERIRLLNAESPEIIKFKDTDYYIFKGNFESEKNFAGMNPKMVCRFWITQLSFDREIVRHIDFARIDTACAMDISFNMTRPTRRRIYIRDLEFHNDVYVN